MKGPLVIGIGNPLRQDDGLGCRAAELVRDRVAPGEAEITECHQLTPELSEKLADASLVVFLDAAVNDCPGRVRCESIAPQEMFAWSHNFSPSELLSLARVVNGVIPPAFLIIGGVVETGFGEGVTPGTEQCAATMAGLAAWIVSNWRSANHP